jgi:hypothetical protein
MTKYSRYSKNCFIHNWIIQKSHLTGKLTKLKFTLEQTIKAQRGSRGIAALFLNLATRWGWVVNATPRAFYTWVRDLVPIVKETGWVPGPVRMGTENLAPSGIQSPDHPTCSKSLYWLCYPSLEINIPISGKLRYLATSFPQRCQIKQFLL